MVQAEAKGNLFIWVRRSPSYAKMAQTEAIEKLVYFGEAQPILCKGNIFPATNYSFSAKIHKTFAYSIYVNAIRSTLILSLLPALSKNRP